MLDVLKIHSPLPPCQQSPICSSWQYVPLPNKHQMTGKLQHMCISGQQDVSRNQFCEASRKHVFHRKRGAVSENMCFLPSLLEYWCDAWPCSCHLVMVSLPRRKTGHRDPIALFSACTTFCCLGYTNPTVLKAITFRLLLQAAEHHPHRTGRCMPLVVCRQALLGDRVQSQEKWWSSPVSLINNPPSKNLT